MTNRKPQNKLDAALDELIQAEKDPTTILSENGLLKQLTKRLIERSLNGELDHHFGYSKYDRSDLSNNRNGSSSKELVTNNGVMDISVPRDREGSFDPILIKKATKSYSRIR